MPGLRPRLATATGRQPHLAPGRAGALRRIGPGAGEDATIASWLPVLRGLTPHGLRHGHQTWMDEDGIPDVLKTERMGHELPGMHGVYGHVSPAMRANLKAALQERWEASLRERALLNPRSIVPLLDSILAEVSFMGATLAGDPFSQSWR